VSVCGLSGFQVVRAREWVHMCMCSAREAVMSTTEEERERARARERERERERARARAKRYGPLAAGRGEDRSRRLTSFLAGAPTASGPPTAIEHSVCV
jgi:hypothetical protein